MSEVTIQKFEDGNTAVFLEDGFTVKFWIRGLSDEEYIERTRTLREFEIKEGKWHE
jgi:hypothetical protein